jgi:hypothetical protein
MTEQQPSRQLLLLVAGVLILGTVLVALGTSDSHEQGLQANRGLPPETVCAPLAGSPALTERAVVLDRMQCAGCHSRDRRETGPPYEMVAARYRCRPIELSGALSHPTPGWEHYPPGPAGAPLTGDDRAALVYWILGVGGKGDE